MAFQHNGRKFISCVHQALYSAEKTMTQTKNELETILLSGQGDSVYRQSHESGFWDVHIIVTIWVGSTEKLKN